MERWVVMHVEVSLPKKIIAFFALAAFAFAIPVFAGDGKEKKKSDLERGLAIFGAGTKLFGVTQRAGWIDERNIGRDIAGEVFMRYGSISDNSALIDYVSKVGHTVADSATEKSAQFMFAVVQNESANAFAAPGGYIFVTTGLLRNLKNEAELAGVLGHEIAHVTKRHMMKTINRTRQLEGAAELAAVLSNKDINAYREILKSASNILFTHGLDKNMEFEADRLGTQYADAVGYRADGLKNFLVTLRKMGKKSGSIFFSTHPSTEQRINILTGEVLSRYRISGVTNEKRYRSAIR